MSATECRPSLQAGWEHSLRGQPQVGYYIGRPHPPYTEVRLVQSVDPKENGYLVDVANGEPGHLITRVETLMSG